jgi:hypothetical protein
VKIKTNKRHREKRGNRKKEIERNIKMEIGKCEMKEKHRKKQKETKTDKAEERVE